MTVFRSSTSDLIPSSHDFPNQFSLSPSLPPKKGKVKRGGKEGKNEFSFLTMGSIDSFTHSLVRSLLPCFDIQKAEKIVM